MKVSYLFIVYQSSYLLALIAPFLLLSKMNGGKWNQVCKQLLTMLFIAMQPAKSKHYWKILRRKQNLKTELKKLKTIAKEKASEYINSDNVKKLLKKATTKVLKNKKLKELATEKAEKVMEAI